MGSLMKREGATVRCSTHGGEYQVLFQRESNTMDTSTPGSTPSSASPSGGAPPATPTVPAGMRCVQHPGSPATQQCQSCGAYMCATCDFELPGGFHYCPACATKPRSALSPKRKRAMIISIATAALASVSFVGTIIWAGLHPAENAMEQQALGVAMMFVVLVPAIVGLSMGLGAIDRRQVNPMSLWIGAIWNGVIIGGFVLLAIVGSFS